MPSVEKSAKTVDLAIEAALEELGLPRDQVQVDILQIESSGILGVFGRKEGRVRVSPLKGGRAEEPPAPRESSRQRQKEGSQPRQQRAARPDQPKSSPKPAPQKPAPAPRPERPRPSPVRAERIEASDKPEEPVEEILAPQAAEILKKITSYYGLDVKVEAEETNRAINLRVGGEDIGQLIGRRGRTLGSVQYIISRILNEDRPNKKKILIDVDGYCESRERTLREMAEKAADRVVQTGRPYALRPMSAQDRRMIHLTLQDHTLVSTESVGEEGSRLVVVYSRSMNPEDLARFLEQAPSMAEGRPPRRGGDRSRGHGRGPRGPSREGGRDRGPRPSGPRREPSL